MNMFTRVGATAGVLTLGITTLAAAPAVAAEELAEAGEPWCEITRVVNSNPGSSGTEGAQDWWDVYFRTSDGLEDWSFHFLNKAPGDVWIYDYYLRPDLDASEAAGHLVYPNVAGAQYLEPAPGEYSFFLLVPDGDAAPVVDCVAG